MFGTEDMGTNGYSSSNYGVPETPITAAKELRTVTKALAQGEVTSLLIPLSRFIYNTTYIHAIIIHASSQSQSENPSYQASN